jgi:DNA-binding response OmpR family regulator
MIVDDEEDITSVLRKGLERHGFRVDAFTDPLDALSSFKKDLYDLLLLDIRMPKMDGFELYKNMEKIDGRVKVCFMTAFEVYYDALKELFPDLYSSLCFVRKPFAIEEFAKRLDNEIQGKE